MNTLAPIPEKPKKTSDAYLFFAPVISSLNKKRSGEIFTMILFAFIVGILLIALLMGTRVYSAVNSSRITSDDTRLGLSLIANSVRINDHVNGISISRGPEGKALVLSEQLETGSYETRIYAYQGKIVEEYSLADKEYLPENAREIVASELFELEYSDGLLNLSTDYGSVNVAFRSEKEAR